METIMSKYRQNLPQLGNRLFLTDAGTETTIIYHDGIDLPYFAVFDLLKSEKGTTVLREYYSRHAAIARANGLGFILESPTWRASADWGPKLGYTRLPTSIASPSLSSKHCAWNSKPPNARCRSAAALVRVVTATIPAAS
jgi:hypothetical protein